MNRMIWLSGAAVLMGSIGLLSGCTALQRGPGNWDAAVGVSWQLVSIQGGDVPDDNPPTLRFSADERTAGSTGSNRLFSTYHVEPDGTLRFAAIGTTRMASFNPERQALEILFLQHLAAVDRYRIRGDRLTLWGDGKRLMTFVADEAPPTPE